jgi:hypothetical protein
MIPRRALLAGGIGITAGGAAASPVPAGDSLAFRLVRHGTEIGRHTLTFAHQGDALSVHIAVAARVTFLSLPIVRYVHQAVETWNGDTLSGLSGEADRNGEHDWVRAQRTSAGLVVVGSKARQYLAPASALGSSYWNRQGLDGPMVSLEDGVLLRPTVTRGAVEAIRLASGAAIPARRYSLRGAIDVDVWYDDADTWAGMAFAVIDGSTVRYERL